jgi:hypothetical protein
MKLHPGAFWRRILGMSGSMSRPLSVKKLTLMELTGSQRAKINAPRNKTVTEIMPKVQSEIRYESFSRAVVNRLSRLAYKEVNHFGAEQFDMVRGSNAANDIATDSGKQLDMQGLQRPIMQ